MHFLPIGIYYVTQLTKFDKIYIIKKATTFNTQLLELEMGFEPTTY